MDTEHWYPINDDIDHDLDDDGTCVCGPQGQRFIPDGEDEVWLWIHQKLTLEPEPT